MSDLLGYRFAVFLSLEDNVHQLMKEVPNRPPVRKSKELDPGKLNSVLQFKFK